MRKILLTVLFWGILGFHSPAKAEWTLNPDKELTSFAEDAPLTFLTEPAEVKFTRKPETISWISDIEHVIEPRTGQVLLADAENPCYLCSEVIPGGKSFELFPYHYYDQAEENTLGGRISYKLIMENISADTVTVEIEGIGNTTDWEHSKTWKGAFGGDGKTQFKLKAGEKRTLWQENGLRGGYPWSAIVLGKTSGAVRVTDYAYLGPKDPDADQAKQMPDLALKPYEAPSFTRGLADWNEASIDFFPGKRDGKNRIGLKGLEGKMHSVAFASAPGGPVTNLWAYNLYDQTFKADKLNVIDPVSGKGHLFFGGNYPVMYKINLPVINDTDEPKTVNLFLCSNDFCCVHTLVGIWGNGQFHNRLVPVVGWDQHWRAASVTLKPGQADDLDLTIVPLGSRWAGLIASLEVAEPGVTRTTVNKMKPVTLAERRSRFGWKPGEYWLKLAARYVEENRSLPAVDNVLIGDSLTERFPVDKMFPGKNVVNRGIGGDRIDGLTTRLDLSIYDLNPSVVFLNIGVNDILFPITPYKNLKRRYGLLLNKLKKNCPNTTVIMQTVLPTTDKFADFNDEIIDLNKDIRRLAMEHKYKLIDLHPYFTDDKGQLKAELTVDGVHLSEKGYQLWTSLMREYIK